MKLYTAIQICLAAMMVIFECIVIQIYHTTPDKVIAKDIGNEGLIVFIIYIGLALVIYVIKEIIKMYYAGELLDQILQALIGGAILVGAIGIWAAGVQIWLSLGAKPESAIYWPVPFLFIGAFILPFIERLFEIVFKRR